MCVGQIVAKANPKAPLKTEAPVSLEMPIAGPAIDEEQSEHHHSGVLIHERLLAMVGYERMNHDVVFWYQ